MTPASHLQTTPAPAAADNKPAGRTYFGIQALRAFAALLVVVFHSAGSWNDRLALTPINPAYWGNTLAGVDLFFVISGFVMGVTTPGLMGLPNKAGVFLWRRIIRIVPLYWIFTTLTIMRLKFGPGSAHIAIKGWWPVVASYLFIPSPHTQVMPIPILTVGWTLNFEMMFYVLFAFALFWEIPLLWFLAPALGGIATVGWFERHSAALSGSPISPLVLEFLFGVVIARFTLRRRLPGQAVGWLLLLGGGAVLLTLPASALGDRALSWGLPAAAVVTGAVTLEGRLGRRWPRWLLELGNASYAIYLVHTFLVSIIWTVLLRMHLQGPSTLGLMVGAALVLSMAAGEVVHRLIELPVVGRLRGKRVRGVSTLPAEVATGVRP